MSIMGKTVHATEAELRGCYRGEHIRQVNPVKWSVRGISPLSLSRFLAILATRIDLHTDLPLPVLEKGFGHGSKGGHSFLSPHFLDLSRKQERESRGQIRCPGIKGTEPCRISRLLGTSPILNSLPPAAAFATLRVSGSSTVRGGGVNSKGSRGFVWPAGAYGSPSYTGMRPTASAETR